MGKEGVELSLNMSTMSKQRVLERYKQLERYKVLERYDFSATIEGGANVTVIDTWGEGDFSALFNLFDVDGEILWYEPDFTVESPGGSSQFVINGEVIPWGVTAVGAASGWSVSDATRDNVHVYVVDSGIENTDLNVVERIDFQNDGLSGDPDGHGTHVAGLIGAIDNSSGILGVAPGVPLHDYRVLDQNGLADVSVVIAAVEMITKKKLDNPSRPMVVNMSLGENIGTTEYTALDDAITASIAAGVVYVVAAGNSEANAAFFTPAHVGGAITVGSFGQLMSDEKSEGYSFSWFSNHGPLIDVLAPGDVLISLAAGGGLEIQSGTSMAAAHVTGLVARHLAGNPSASPATVEYMVKKSARTSVENVPNGTSSAGASILYSLKLYSGTTLISTTEPVTM